MVRMRRLKDENLDSECQRPLDMSIVLSHQVETSPEVQRSSSGASAGGSLAKIALLTSEMVSRARITGIRLAGTVEALVVRTTQGRIPPARRARTVAGGGNHGLEHRTSEMN